MVYLVSQPGLLASHPRRTMGIPNELRGFLPRPYTRLCPGICARVPIYSAERRSCALLRGVIEKSSATLRVDPRADRKRDTDSY